jgi:hypothetical protein
MRLPDGHEKWNLLAEWVTVEAAVWAAQPVLSLTLVVVESVVPSALYVVEVVLLV